MINKKKITILALILGFFGVLLIFIGNSNQSESEVQIYREYTNEIESKLEDFLLQADGIRKVNVIVSVDTNKDENSTNGFNVGNSEGTERVPTVKGVAIACTNGDNDRIRLKIISIVSAYLGIPTNKIEVIGIK